MEAFKEVGWCLCCKLDYIRFYFLYAVTIYLTRREGWVGGGAQHECLPQPQIRELWLFLEKQKIVCRKRTGKKKLFSSWQGAAFWTFFSSFALFPPHFSSLYRFPWASARGWRELSDLRGDISIKQSRKIYCLRGCERVFPSRGL